MKIEKYDDLKPVRHIAWYEGELNDIKEAARLTETTISDLIRAAVHRALEQGLPVEKSPRRFHYGVPQNERGKQKTIGLRWHRDDLDRLHTAAKKEKLRPAGYIRRAVLPVVAETLAQHNAPPAQTQRTLSISFAESAGPDLSACSVRELSTLQKAIEDELRKRGKARTPKATGSAAKGASLRS